MTPQLIIGLAIPAMILWMVFSIWIVTKIDNAFFGVLTGLLVGIAPIWITLIVVGLK